MRMRVKQIQFGEVLYLVSYKFNNYIHDRHVALSCDIHDTIISNFMQLTIFMLIEASLLSSPVQDTIKTYLRKFQTHCSSNNTSTTMQLLGTWSSASCQSDIGLIIDDTLQDHGIILDIGWIIQNREGSKLRTPKSNIHVTVWRRLPE